MNASYTAGAGSQEWELPVDHLIMIWSASAPDNARCISADVWVRASWHGMHGSTVLHMACPAVGLGSKYLLPGPVILIGGQKKKVFKTV